MREEVRHSEGGGGGDVGRQKDFIMNTARKWLDQKIKNSNNKTRELYNKDSLVIFKSKT